jgi:cleavage and polyadenylation specificity factor subunit 4
MYKLGFCVYGPQCRYKHTRLPAPPPPPESIEAAKPREFRDPNKVVNFVNPGARPRPLLGVGRVRLQCR